MPPTRLPGAAFKNDRLFVFEPDAVIVVQGWPNPSAVRHLEGTNAWTAFRPKFPLVRPYRRKKKTPTPSKPATRQLDLVLGSTPDQQPCSRHLTPAQKRRRAFDRFRFSLPKPVAARLEKFTTRQWDLLTLLHQHGTPAIELARARPALAYLLALHSANRRLAITTTARLLALKGRGLAGELGLPPRPATVKIIDKIHTPSFSQTLAVQLRQALSNNPDKVTKSLAHLPSVHAGVISLVEDSAVLARVSPALLLEASKKTSERYRTTLARRIREVIGLETILGTRARPFVFRDTATLLRVHADLSRQRTRQDIRYTRSIRRGHFPPPPIPGSQHIVPLRAEDDLHHEGDEQSNCVASYANAVRSGKIYIYQVLFPQRCTLAIAPDDAGNWHRQELEIEGNAQPSNKTRQFVDDWLARYTLGA